MLDYYKGFMDSCTKYGITRDTAMGLFKEAAVNKQILGIASTKMSPDQYYKATGQLKDKKKKGKTPGADNRPLSERHAVVKKAADQLRTPAMDQYFRKCAELGLRTDMAVNAIVSHMGPKAARECRVSDIGPDPYVTLAVCMLDK